MRTRVTLGLLSLLICGGVMALIASGGAESAARARFAADGADNRGEAVPSDLLRAERRENAVSGVLTLREPGPRLRGPRLRGGSRAPERSSANAEVDSPRQQAVSEPPTTRTHRLISSHGHSPQHSTAGRLQLRRSSALEGGADFAGIERLLETDDPASWYKAARALQAGNTPSGDRTRVLDRLLRVIDDPRHLQRWTALRMYVHAADSETEAAPLLRRLLGDADVVIRRAAVDHLGKLGRRGVAVRADLLDAEPDSDALVREIAGEWLRELSR